MLWARWNFRPLSIWEKSSQSANTLWAFFADQQAAIRAVDREMGGGGGEIYSEPGHMASDFTGIEYRVLRVQDPNRTSPPVFAKDVGDDPHGRQLGCLFVGMDDNDYKAVKNSADE